MIQRAELTASARSYLRAARLLNRRSSSSPDASAYLCGYAVEIALKANICTNLGWTGYPSTNNEFKNYLSFKTHNLDVLLHLSSVEARIKTSASLLADWSVVQKWNPEQRYSPVGTRTATEAKDMIEATTRLLGDLL